MGFFKKLFCNHNNLEVEKFYHITKVDSYNSYKNIRVEFITNYKCECGFFKTVKEKEIQTVHKNNILTMLSEFETLGFKPLINNKKSKSNQ